MRPLSLWETEVRLTNYGQMINLLERNRRRRWLRTVHPRNMHAVRALLCLFWIYYDDAIMGKMAPQITSLTIVYSTVYSDADQRKHQSSVSLAFVRGIHRGPVNSPHKWPATRKMSLFDDVIMCYIDLLPRSSRHASLALGECMFWYEPDI